jgi:putative membrane protein
MKLLIKPLVIACSLAAFACNGGGGNATSDSTTAKTDSTKADTMATANRRVTSGEQDFINYAVPANTKEIIWLRAGIKQGQNKDLKNHAKMMLKDHQKLDATVKNYLSSHNNLSVPTVDTSNVVGLQDKKGKDWDKGWADQMVSDHSELLTKLKQSQNDVRDTALASIINNKIPVVDSHLQMAKTVQAKLR